MAKFSVSWRRFIPFLGYHHVLMILALIGTILLSILIAGCTSNGLKNVYLLSFQYADKTHSPTKPDPVQVNPNISSTFSDIVKAGAASLEIRVGYLGLCMSQEAGEWVCSSSAHSLARLLKPEDDPLNLVWTAGKFKDQIVFDGLLFTALPLQFLNILLLMTFPGWHEEVSDDGSDMEVRPFPSRPVSQAALGLATIAAVFAFITGFLQHIASATGSTMVHSLSYGTVNGHVGTAAMILGWAGILLYLVVMVGILLMILSIRVLAAMTDTGPEEP
ncbi:Ca2+ regulator and membrane fusion protein Fig1-domain-containing protein [Xylogone sp. PMI_703]|nr:Ca2+ regulator and membrane fusion protein Fig1-domain-containing protein [Xylogone sp. PMI_703]